MGSKENDKRNAQKRFNIGRGSQSHFLMFLKDRPDKFLYSSLSENTEDCMILLPLLKNQKRPYKCTKIIIIIIIINIIVVINIFAIIIIIAII